MAQYHFYSQVLGRKQGAHAVALVAYRFGAKMTCEQTGQTWDYRHKREVVYRGIWVDDSAPSWAQAASRGCEIDSEVNGALLANFVESFEKRRDAQLFREIRVALPIELNQEQSLALLYDFVHTHCCRLGMMAVPAIHWDEGNPHAHVLLSLREMTEQGFGLKCRAWNERNTLLSWRAAWAETTNQHLERAGFEERVDHRSYAERGIELVPGIHRGPTERMDARGTVTRKGVEQAQIDATNRARVKENPEVVLPLLGTAFSEATLQETLHRYTAGRERVASDWVGMTPEALCEEVLRQVTWTEAVFSDRQLERVLNDVEDGAELAALLEQVKQSPELIALGLGDDGFHRYTTRRWLEQEVRLAEAAEWLQARFDHVGEVMPPVGNEAFTPSQEQLLAVQRLAQGADLALLVGQAGTGKTTVLQPLQQMWHQQGYRVIGMAPTNRAAQVLGDSLGVEAMTLARWQSLVRHEIDELTGQTVVLVDEAGLVGSEAMTQLLEQAAQAGAKVVLSGDPAQLPGVSPGQPFRALVHQHGAATLTEVHRQRLDWMKVASQQLGVHDVVAGLKAYQDHVVYHPQDAIAGLAQGWVNDPARPEDKLVVTFTNQDVQRLNQAIRAARSVGDQEAAAQLTSGPDLPVAVGDRLMFTDNTPHSDGRIHRNQLATVREIHPEQLVVTLDGSDIPKVLSLAERWPLQYGYATTVWKAQGMTVTSCHLYINHRWSKHMLYVGLTRHRERVAIYVEADTIPNLETLTEFCSYDSVKESVLDYPLALAEYLPQARTPPSAVAGWLENLLHPARARARAERERAPLPTLDVAEREADRALAHAIRGWQQATSEFAAMWSLYVEDAKARGVWDDDDDLPEEEIKSKPYKALMRLSSRRNDLAQSLVEGFIERPAVFERLRVDVERLLQQAGREELLIADLDERAACITLRAHIRDWKKAAYDFAQGWAAYVDEAKARGGWQNGRLSESEQASPHYQSLMTQKEQRNALARKLAESFEDQRAVFRRFRVKPQRLLQQADREELLIEDLTERATYVDIKTQVRAWQQAAKDFAQGWAAYVDEAKARDGWQNGRLSETERASDTYQQLMAQKDQRHALARQLAEYVEAHRAIFIQFKVPIERLLQQAGREDLLIENLTARATYVDIKTQVRACQQAVKDFAQAEATYVDEAKARGGWQNGRLSETERASDAYQLMKQKDQRHHAVRRLAGSVEAHRAVLTQFKVPIERLLQQVNREELLIEDSAERANYVKIKMGVQIWRRMAKEFAQGWGEYVIEAKARGGWQNGRLSKAEQASDAYQRLMAQKDQRNRMAQLLTTSFETRRELLQQFKVPIERLLQQAGREEFLIEDLTERATYVDIKTQVRAWQKAAKDFAQGWAAYVDEAKARDGWQDGRLTRRERASDTYQRLMAQKTERNQVARDLIQVWDDHPAVFERLKVNPERLRQHAQQEAQAAQARQATMKADIKAWQQAHQALQRDEARYRAQAIECGVWDEVRGEVLWSERARPQHQQWQQRQAECHRLARVVAAHPDIDSEELQLDRVALTEQAQAPAPLVVSGLPMPDGLDWLAGYQEEERGSAKRLWLATHIAVHEPLYRQALERGWQQNLERDVGGPIWHDQDAWLQAVESHRCQEAAANHDPQWQREWQQRHQFLWAIAAHHPEWDQASMSEAQDALNWHQQACRKHLGWVPGTEHGHPLLSAICNAFDARHVLPVEHVTLLQHLRRINLATLSRQEQQWYDSLYDRLAHHLIQPFAVAQPAWVNTPEREAHFFELTGIRDHTDGEAWYQQWQQTQQQLARHQHSTHPTERAIHHRAHQQQQLLSLIVSWKPDWMDAMKPDERQHVRELIEQHQQDTWPSHEVRQQQHLQARCENNVALEADIEAWQQAHRRAECAWNDYLQKTTTYMVCYPESTSLLETFTQQQTTRDHLARALVRRLESGVDLGSYKPPKVLWQQAGRVATERLVSSSHDGVDWLAGYAQNRDHTSNVKIAIATHIALHDNLYQAAVEQGWQSGIEQAVGGPVPQSEFAWHRAIHQVIDETDVTIRQRRSEFLWAWAAKHGITGYHSIDWGVKAVQQRQQEALGVSFEPEPQDIQERPLWALHNAIRVQDHIPVAWIKAWHTLDEMKDHPALASFRSYVGHQVVTRHPEFESSGLQAIRNGDVIRDGDAWVAAWEACRGFQRMGYLAALGVAHPDWTTPLSHVDQATMHRTAQQYPESLREAIEREMGRERGGMGWSF